MAKEESILESSGNVFADLGLPRPEEALAKAKLAHAISKLIEKSDLTQSQAAEILGIDQAKVSALTRGKLSGFPVERLFRFLNALGQDVEIRLKQKPKTRDHARVQVVGK